MTATRHGSPVLELLAREDTFQSLRDAASRLGRMYAVFLVDHGPASRSTHRFWWNHFDEACRALGIPCARVSRFSAQWPPPARDARTRVYLFFTARSLYRDRLSRRRSVPREAVRACDIVASWDPAVLEAFPDAQRFLIGFRSPQWMAQYGHGARWPVAVWEPFAPLAAVEAGLRDPQAQPAWDFTYFGSLTPHNYDLFRAILRPLAARYHCRYGGKAWRVMALTPFLLGFSPHLVDEASGLDLLARGRVNLVLHNDYHRRAQSLTERLFISTALGRPVVCDNPGARRYFTPSEVPVGEDTETFLALCEDALRSLRQREEIARTVQRKVWRSYTYLHTVVQFLTDVDSTVPPRAGVSS
ncbi:MAG: glycosyltransferase [Armatimonadota bacterium]|nr:glycosyltransferase [Armatimonadota bacterium]